MSSSAIERLLWQINSGPAEVQRFRADADAYLKDFRVNDEERALLKSWDVAEMYSRGVSPLLLVSAFAAVNGIDKVPEYLMRINQPDGAAPAQ